MEQEGVEPSIAFEVSVLVIGEVGPHLERHPRTFELVLACEDLSCASCEERRRCVLH